MHDFYETAILLREKYFSEDDPHKNIKVDILGQIVAKFFMNQDKLPNHIRIQYIFHELPYSYYLLQTATAILEDLSLNFTPNGGGFIPQEGIIKKTDVYYLDFTLK